MKTTEDVLIFTHEEGLSKAKHKFSLLMYAIRLLTFVVLFTSCGQSDRVRIYEAKKVVDERPDSAYVLLKGVEYAHLNDDRDKADYILTKAKANMYMGRTLVTDSLLPVAIAYYNANNDSASAYQAIIARAKYLRAIEQPQAANALLDSLYLKLISLDKLTSINKTLLEFSFKDKDFNRSLFLIDRQLGLLDDETERLDFEIKKITPLNTLGQSKKAVALCDSLFALPNAPEVGSMEWVALRINYAAALGESRSTAPKAVEIMEDILRRLGSVPDKHLLELYIPMVNLQMNAGNLEAAQKYVRLISDLNIPEADYDAVVAAYYNFLKIVLDYEKTGALSFSQLSNVAHNLRKVSADLEIKRQERDNALEAAYDLSRDKYELTIKQQTLWLILFAVTLFAVITILVIAYTARKRRQRLIDAEEKIETLEELVKSVQNVNSNDKQGLLKKLLLQQLGIIKTFAESPTSQNQEALRKIRNIGNADEKSNTLVKWNDFYQIIDELYGNFHKDLINRYPNLFSEREINILCLIRAGFSTKEIGVLVEQTSNSIYVSKTAIRKKLGVGVKEDIMAYLTSKSDASATA